MRIFSTEPSRKNKKSVAYNILPVVKDMIYRSVARMKTMYPKISLNYSELVEDAFFHLLNSEEIMYQVNEETYTFRDLLMKDLRSLSGEIKKKIEENIYQLIEEIEKDLRTTFEEALPTDYPEELEYELKDRVEGEEENAISEIVNVEFPTYLEENRLRVLDELSPQFIDRILQEYFESGLEYIRLIDKDFAKELIEYVDIIYKREILELDFEEYLVLGVILENKPILFYEGSRQKCIQDEYKKQVQFIFLELKSLMKRIKEGYGEFSSVNFSIEEETETIVKFIKAEAMNFVKIRTIMKYNKKNPEC